jgi:hypothetical protein
MGWKLSSVLINTPNDTNYEELLNELGFRNLLKIENDSFETAMYPEQGKVYVGKYNGNIIICADELPLDFFNESLSATEKTLIKFFPKSEIFAASLHSVINHFGFAVINAGKKIRVKAGDADSGTTIDIGKPLEQEEELLAKSKIDDNGQRLYYLDKNSDEPYFENQVGENFVFEIFRRYTGEELSSDENLMNTDFIAYTFSRETLSNDQYFSGEWLGQYTYGEGYQNSLQGKSEGFTIAISLTDGAIKGTCTDGNKQTDNPSIIEGFLFDPFIGFIKKYPFTYIIDKNGLTHKDTSKPANNITYSGLYDPLSDSFKGIWRIENKKYWGEWTMKRKGI